MTKEEKIKEAYCEHWEDLHPQAKKSALENNGWIGSIIEHAPKKIDLEFNKMTFRPKSLQGIENNNGWIKIESDLPKTGDICFIYDIDNFTGIAVFCTIQKVFKTRFGNEYENVTHYQEIIKPKPPIY